MKDLDDMIGDRKKGKESDDMDKILRTKDLCKYYGSGENEVRAVQNAT